jgi:phospholipid/cholesterol/gamma-HCH transport system substrate-binding protein
MVISQEPPEATGLSAGGSVPSQKQVKWSELRVGLTVLFASLTLAVLVFVMSGTVSPFSHKIVLYSYFENAAGLVKGAPVRLSGVDIGNVDRITISHDPKRRLTPVEVVMKISARHQNEIFKGDSKSPNDTGSRATLATAGVLGATFVDIDSSRASGRPVQDNDELSTTETPALQDVLKSSQGTLDKLNVILGRVDDIVSAIQSGKGSVGKIINDPELYNRANATVAQLQELTNQITSGKGSIGKLLYSDELYDKINDSVTKLNTIVNDVNTGKGNLGKLLKDEQLYDNVNQTTAKLKDLMTDIDAGKGTLGKLAKDQEYAQKIDRITSDLQTISDRLAAGEGTAGMLLKNPSLYNNSDQMLIETRNLIKALRENPKKYLTIRFKVF